MFCLKDFVHAPINNGCLHCGSTNLHVLANNNMLTQLGSCGNKNACYICLGVYTTYAELVSLKLLHTKETAVYQDKL